MTTNNNQTEPMDAKCCIQFCETKFEVSGQQIVNRYRCENKVFTNADLWNLQKTRKQFMRRAGL